MIDPLIEDILTLTEYDVPTPYDSLNVAVIKNEKSSGFRYFGFDFTGHDGFMEKARANKYKKRSTNEDQEKKKNLDKWYEIQLEKVRKLLSDLLPSIQGIPYNQTVYNHYKNYICRRLAPLDFSS